jgi:uncharacterized membrane protein YvbJ
LETKSADLSSLRIDKTKREEYSNPEKKKKKIFWSVIAVVVIIAGFILIRVWNHFSSAVEVELTS